MKTYAVLLLVPAAMVGAWYLGTHVDLANPLAVAAVPKYGLADLPSVSTERVRREPTPFTTVAFGIKRERLAPALPVRVVPAQVVVVAVSVLHAVMIDGDRRIAQIDGNALREGGLVGRQRVAQIEARRVKLINIDGGQVTWLSLDRVN